MIISLVNSKGGVGKTTIAINISYYLVIIKRSKVLLIDADPQGSCLHWKEITEAKDFDIIHHPKADFHKTIEALTLGFRHVIIDCPPGAGDISISALMVSDLAIIPVGASLLDMFSTKATIELVTEAKNHNKKLKAKLLITKKVIGTVPAREARESLASYGIPIFKTEIGHRIDFVRAMVEGLPILKYAPHSYAAMEIENLCKEIL
jgi:chromosome partitioning protein